MDTSFKQSLKAQAHHLKPIILIGSKGLTEAIVAETKLALEAHELIKVKINGEEKAEKINIINELCHLLSADLIQMIGNTAVIYLKKKDEFEQKNKKRTKTRAPN